MILWVNAVYDFLFWFTRSVSEKGQCWQCFVWSLLVLAFQSCPTNKALERLSWCCYDKTKQSKVENRHCTSTPIPIRYMKYNNLARKQNCVQSNRTDISKSGYIKHVMNKYRGTNTCILLQCRSVIQTSQTSSYVRFIVLKYILVTTYDMTNFMPFTSI